VQVAGPPGAAWQPEASVLDECARLSALSGAGKATVVVTAEEAVQGADFVYADSWMSYGEWAPKSAPSVSPQGTTCQVFARRSVGGPSI